MIRPVGSPLKYLNEEQLRDVVNHSYRSIVDEMEDIEAYSGERSEFLHTWHVQGPNREGVTFFEGEKEGLVDVGYYKIDSDYATVWHGMAEDSIGMGIRIILARSKGQRKIKTDDTITALSALLTVSLKTFTDSFINVDDRYTITPIGARTDVMSRKSESILPNTYFTFGGESLILVIVLTLDVVDEEAYKPPSSEREGGERYRLGKKRFETGY